MHSTNYFNTFIEIAEDSPTGAGTIPMERGGAPTQAGLQYSLLQGAPYRYTSDEILFEVFARGEAFSKAARDAAFKAYFSRGRACFRASPLTKRHGWGVHFNASGKMALYGAETEAYARFLTDPEIRKLKAMRNRRKAH